MRVDNRPGLSTAPAKVIHSRIHSGYPQSGRGQCGKSRDSASHLCTARRASRRSGHGSNPSPDASTAVLPAPAPMELLLMNLYGFRSTQSPTRRRRVGWARSRSEFGCTLRGVVRRGERPRWLSPLWGSSCPPMFPLGGFSTLGRVALGMAQQLSTAVSTPRFSSYPQANPQRAKDLAGGR